MKNLKFNLSKIEEILKNNKITKDFKRNTCYVIMATMILTTTGCSDNNNKDFKTIQEESENVTNDEIDTFKSENEFENYYLYGLFFKKPNYNGEYSSVETFFLSKEEDLGYGYTNYGLVEIHEDDEFFLFSESMYGGLLYEIGTIKTAIEVKKDNNSEIEYYGLYTYDHTEKGIRVENNLGKINSEIVKNYKEQKIKQK